MAPSSTMGAVIPLSLSAPTKVVVFLPMRHRRAAAVSAQGSA